MSYTANHFAYFDCILMFARLLVDPMLCVWLMVPCVTCHVGCEQQNGRMRMHNYARRTGICPVVIDLHVTSIENSTSMDDNHHI